MIAKKLKLSKADHSNIWTFFRFQALFHHEKHLHFHQNIGVYNLTRRNKRKKATNISKIVYEARKLIKNNLYSKFSTLR